MKRSKFTEEQIAYAMRQLDEENHRLKQLVADLTLDKHILQETLRENERNCTSEPFPVRALRLELSAARSRQRIEARPPVVLRDAPLGADPTVGFEPVKGRIQRAIVHHEQALGRRLNRMREVPAVVRSALQEARDDEIQSALQDADLAE